MRSHAEAGCRNPVPGPGPEPAGRDWAGQRERGSDLLLRVAVFLVRRLGWQAGRALLVPITLWFLVASPGARRASRGFLGRALDRPPRGRDVLRHLWTFASVILDRVFLLSGRMAGFRLTVEGLDALTQASAAGRGCILLGSHLGSFDALRAFGRDSPRRVSPVMFRRNSGPLTRLLEGLDPALGHDIIEIGAPDAMLRVRERLACGEMVGFLADRAPAGERVVAVPFLGTPAPLPAGPMVIASLLDAPVVLFFGLRTGPRRYTIRFEPFALGWSCRGRGARRRCASSCSTMPDGSSTCAGPIRSTGSTSSRSGRRAMDRGWQGRQGGKSLLFLKKKKQKDFCFLGSGSWAGSELRERSVFGFSPWERPSFSILRAGLVLVLAFSPGVGRAASLAETVMDGLARLPSRSAAFTEERRLSSLTRPLSSSGTLSFTRPGPPGTGHALAAPRAPGDRGRPAHRHRGRGRGGTDPHGATGRRPGAAGAGGHAARRPGRGTCPR